MVLAINAQAQKFTAAVFGGVSYYQGDLQPKSFTSKELHGAYGVGLLYEISEKFYGRLNLRSGTISGDDKKNPDDRTRTRNLNFTSSIMDVSLGLEYHILNIHRYNIAPYVFAGVGYFHYNPKAIDVSGKKVALQPLGTEGQGFLPGSDPYKLNQMSLPFGAGVKYRLSDYIQLGIEVDFNKTFTDYLDDVSTVYVDKNTLLTNRGQVAVDLAFREDELFPTHPYPKAGEKRGYPNKKDWYYFTGFSIYYTFNPLAKEDREEKRNRDF